MTSQDELSIESLRAMADSAGLSLSDAEIEQLLVGVRRNKQMAAVVRAVVTPDLEPVPVFEAPQIPKGKE